MELIIGVVALCVGLFIGKIFLSSRKSNADISTENMKLKEQHLEMERESLNNALSKVESENKVLKEDIDRLRSEKESLTIQKHDQEKENVRLKEKNESLENREREVKESVKLYAEELLKTTASDFKKTQDETMEGIVSPLNKQLEDFKRKISDFEKDREDRERRNVESTTSLKTELERVLELNQQLSSDAQGLTKALKGDQKTQGDWGEMKLKKVLESSGLREQNEERAEGEFRWQPRVRSSIDPNKTQIPDCLIQLPDKKHLIIDSKVSLVAYNQFVNAESEQERASYLEKHVDSVRKHIKELSDKHYYSSKDVDSPELVFLFMGLEPALIDALRKDLTLYPYAWEKKIVLVSPSLLLAALKCVASVWMHERQKKNSQVIAEEAGKMYDKFVGFLDSFKDIGEKLDKAHESYGKACGQLKDGRGALIGRAKKIKKLGAPTNKQIGSEWEEDGLGEDDSLTGGPTVPVTQIHPK